jgi:hypothetical protein
MDRKFLRLVIVFFSLVALVAAGVAVWELKVTGYGGFEFRFHQGRYEAIVQGVDAMIKDYDVKMEHAFYATDLSDPLTIRTIWPNDTPPERGKGAGLIYVDTSESGSLIVWIETLDLGHAGEYGYVHAQDGEKPAWNADAWGERWEVGSSVGDGWWKISCRLN